MDRSRADPSMIDISPLISARTAVWPGDVGFQRRVALRLSAGDTVELSSFTTTCHVGAHADAPSHFAEAAPWAHLVQVEVFDPVTAAGGYVYFWANTAATAERIRAYMFTD